MKVDEKVWLFYVLRCCDDTLYAGVTTDLKRRLLEHNTSRRGAKYTRTRRPAKLVFWLDFENRSTAQKAEHKFKKLTREQKEKEIDESR
jgi:putative endonuclease